MAINISKLKNCYCKNCGSNNISGRLDFGSLNNKPEAVCDSCGKSLTYSIYGKIFLLISIVLIFISYMLIESGDTTVLFISGLMIFFMAMVFLVIQAYFFRYKKEIILIEKTKDIILRDRLVCLMLIFFIAFTLKNFLGLIVLLIFFIFWIK